MWGSFVVAWHSMEKPMGLWRKAWRADTEDEIKSNKNKNAGSRKSSMEDIVSSTMYMVVFVENFFHPLWYVLEAA